MIARLSGPVLETADGRLVVECGGVGYEVNVPASVALAFREGDLALLWVRQVVREDDVALYGFLDADQRRVFDLLREVKGCGPKTSLGVLSDLGADGAAAAIVTQDARALTRVSGIGPRLAERILLELKDKIGEVDLERRVRAATRVAVVAVPEDELVDALLALGYRRPEAEAAAASARDAHSEVEDQLRAALRSLRR